MKIEFSKNFNLEYKKIKDKSTRLNILTQIKKLEENPERGKPLKNKLKGYRCLRVKSFRIIYRISNEKIIIVTFESRDKVYK
ncbi:MAG: Plasmid stabilization system protein [Candidatus Methanofastidiosum methylothiophilum]|uniref:Plasmid stabilization system protein n=1 Tax=Candidatus Methanofastidiosum methylothiophilum TaxID=1705564 RepID=A0A150J1B7_9EURY|nr:MAG: Plasmid stabilization system protein [Candidatus Methanofastidiosum methylthiophilus]KYC46731.1 MAG: Plasmid stabilization system protein [Candidatus Methanofastidiosum methylthiophilus]KYC51040.1 MAG: Plasmid stabilization system protein [Candidatus Methanofastidiosum methylthiophilus]